LNGNIGVVGWIFGDLKFPNDFDNLEGMLAGHDISDFAYSLGGGAKPQILKRRGFIIRHIRHKEITTIKKPSPRTETA